VWLAASAAQKTVSVMLKADDVDSRLYCRPSATPSCMYVMSLTLLAWFHLIVKLSGFCSSHMPCVYQDLHLCGYVPSVS